MLKWPMATMVFVTEVPMLAPITMNTALLTLSSLAPTREMMIEVVVDELCTKTVARMPIMTPEIGLSTTSNIFALSFPPKILNPVPITDSTRRNTQMQ